MKEKCTDRKIVLHSHKLLKRLIALVLVATMIFPWSQHAYAETYTATTTKIYYAKQTMRARLESHYMIGFDWWTAPNNTTSVYTWSEITTQFLDLEDVGAPTAWYEVGTSSLPVAEPSGTKTRLETLGDSEYVNNPSPANEGMRRDGGTKMELGKTLYYGGADNMYVGGWGDHLSDPLTRLGDYTYSGASPVNSGVSVAAYSEEIYANPGLAEGSITYTEATPPSSDPYVHIIDVQYSEPFTALVKYEVEVTETNYYNPIVTANDLTKTLDTAVGGASAWNEGVTATWGLTTSNKIPTKGTITDNSLIGGTDPALSTTGTTWDRVGWKPHSYTVKDLHALNNNDGTSTTASRRIIVKSAIAPDLTIKYAAGATNENGVVIAGETYTPGSWTNQNLDLTVTADDPGAYDLMLRANGVNTGNYSSYNGIGSPPASYTLNNYGTETPIAGTEFSVILAGTGDHSIELSPASTTQNVKIDKTAPVISTVVPQQTLGEDDWSLIPSNDAADTLSGLETATGGVYYKFVPYNSSAPVIDNTWDDDYDALYASLSYGQYDLYVYAKDNATNKSSVILANTGGPIAKLLGTTPVVIGYKVNAPLADTILLSDIWSNKDVRLTVSDPVPAESITHYNALFVTGLPPVLEGVAVGSGDSYTHTYSAETAGTDVYGVMLNQATMPYVELSSQSTPFRVKIDKTAPTAAGVVTDQGSYQYLFADNASADNGTVQSGIDTTINTIKFALALPGNTPTDVDYTYGAGTQDFSNSSLPAGEYDVYVKVWDNATNTNMSMATGDKVRIPSQNAPDLSIKYGTNAKDKDGNDVSGQTYTGAWTNAALDITLETDETGNLKGVLKKDTARLNGGALVSGSYTLSGYHDETLAAQVGTGNAITGLLTTNDAAENALSAEAAAQYVKIDTVVPVTGITANSGNTTFTDGSTDDKSGVYKTMIAYVAAGDPAPADSTYAEISTVTITTPGEYDVWAYTIDSAGNASVKAKQLDNIQVVSTEKARLKAEYNDGTLKTYTPGTWINKDIILTVQKPSNSFSYTGDFNSALYYNSTAQLGKGTDDEGDDYVYTSSSNVFDETVYGVMVDSNDQPVSGASDSMVVRVDKVKPTAAAGLDPNTFEILDQSTDTDSGIDSTKTKIAIVPTGDPIPEAGDFTVLDGDTIPNDEEYYDVYMIAADIAGNQSDITKVLENRSTNPKDQIQAGNFERGLDEGVMVDSDARALSNVSGRYYVPSNSILTINQNDITVDSPLLGAVNDQITAGRLGVYDLSFATPTTTPPRPTQSTDSAFSEEADIKVTLYQHGAAGVERIYGNDFLYGVDNGSISEERAKELAMVFAREADLSEMDLSKVTVTAAELEAINEAIAARDVDHNTWPLTFTTTAGEAITVQVSLFDHSLTTPPVPGEETIGANDFEYGMDQGALGDDIAKFLSSVTAVDENGLPIDADDISIDATELAAINDAIAAGDKSGNPFDLTFTSPGNKEVTVKVTLKDHSNPPAAGQAYILGDDFRYASANGSLDEDTVKLLAKVSAEDALSAKIDMANVTVDGTQLAVINDAIAARNNTTFPLTFTEPSGETVTVNVTLYDNGPLSPVPGEAEILANDFSYGISSGSLSDEAAKILSQVAALDGSGMDVDRDDITVDAAELAVINDAIQAGDKSGNPFDLTFTSPQGKEVTVKVTLKDEGPEAPPVDGDEYITGNDFFYGMDQGPLQDGNAGFLSQIDPRNGDGSRMDVDQVILDAAELGTINAAIDANDKSGNPFDLTFATPGGAEVTVQVTLFDHINQNPQPGAAQIVGNDFVYGIDQGSIADDLAKLYADSRAVDALGNPIALTDITVDASELAVINGAIAAKDKSSNPFPLTFTEPSGESVTVYVTLKDHGDGPSAPDDNSERLAANDFFYGLDQDEITDDVAKVLADTVAYEADGGLMDLSQVNVDQDELAVINEAIAAGDKSGNKFDLTFTTPDGTNVTIFVTLKDTGAGITDPDVPGNDTDRIGGNDFFYGVDLPQITPDAAKELAAVEAEDKDGNPIDLSNITVDAGELQVINDAITSGEKERYPLTFATPDGTTVTVIVTLKDNGGGQVDPIDPVNNTERIGANGFIYGIDEGDLSDQAAKFRSQTEAMDREGERISVGDIITDTAELAAINDAIAAGVIGDYPLTYSTPEGTAVTVTVTLKDHAVAPDEDPQDENKTGSGNIGANDFIYGANETDSLTDDEAKVRGRAAAKDAFGNDYELSDIAVDAIELADINTAKQEGRTGKFPLTYSSPEGKSVTVTVTVLNKVDPPVIDLENPENNESSIGANDFNYGRNEGELTPDKAKDLSGVVAKNPEGANVPLDQISVDPDELEAINDALNQDEGGTFPLTFTEPDGKSVTIEVTIWDKVIHNPTPDNQQEIGGDDFEHDIQDGELTEDDAKDLSNIYAKDQLGVDIPLDEIHINKGDLDKINEAIKKGESGQYELRFTTDDGQELSVTVTLFDGKVPVDPDKKQSNTTTKIIKYRKVVKTGDTSDTLLWLSLAGAALLVVFAAYRRRRRGAE